MQLEIGYIPTKKEGNITIEGELIEISFVSRWQ